MCFKAVGCCRAVRIGTSLLFPSGEQGSLFPVYKDAFTDRMVFNRTPRNAKEFHLPGFSKFTIVGVALLIYMFLPCTF